MRVALLALSPRAHGGQYQYTTTLIAALHRLAGQGTVALTVVHHPAYDGVARGDASVTLQGPWARLDTWLATYLGFGMSACRPGRFDVAVSPKTCLAARRSAARSVVTVHDLQHRHLPHFFSPARRVLRERLYRRAARTADAIVCETEYVRNDIVAYYGIPRERIFVVPCPPPSYLVQATVDGDRVSGVAAKFGIPRDYLFYPAQFWAHKNHLLLVESLARLRDACGVAVPLVLVGAPLDGLARTMRRVHALKLERQVFYLGYVPDGDMPYLFAGAAALVVPSLFESLSIPVWEAFHVGVPVVCANTGSFPEQVGDAGLLFNPYDPADCAQQILRCLQDAALRETLVTRGRDRARRLTLDRYAAQWQHVLERVVAH